MFFRHFTLPKNMMNTYMVYALLAIESANGNIEKVPKSMAQMPRHQISIMKEGYNN